MLMLQALHGKGLPARLGIKWLKTGVMLTSMWHSQISQQVGRAIGSFAWKLMCRDECLDLLTVWTAVCVVVV
jgi:hypothetical protein